LTCAMISWWVSPSNTTLGMFSTVADPSAEPPGSPPTAHSARTDEKQEEDR
jgi:hypothetical protein